MKLSSLLGTLTGLVLAPACSSFITTQATQARPVTTEIQVCSFNGVQEHCLATEDTDSFFVTWSDGTRVTYNKPFSGQTSVTSNGKTYPATYRDLGPVVMFTTENGRTTITR